MTYFTEGIRILLQQGETKQAVEKLSLILQNGENNTYQRALDLMEKHTPATPSLKNYSQTKKTISPVIIEAFLKDLERNNLPLLEFLSNHELAEAHLAKKSWKEALVPLKLMLQFHQEDYQISKEDLQVKIDQCEEAVSFLRFMEKGDDFFNLKSWQNALSCYKNALVYQNLEFQDEVEQIKKRIVICGHGIRFEQHLDKAKGLSNQRKWTEAAEFYHKALFLFQDEFIPDKETVNSLLEECLEKAKRGETEVESWSIAAILSKPLVTALTLVFCVGLIITLLMPQEPSSSRSEIPPKTSVTEDKPKTIASQENPEMEKEMEPNLSINSTVDSTSQIVEKTDSTPFQLTPFNAKEVFSIKEPEELQNPVEDLAEEEPETENVETSEGTMALVKPKFTPGRVAIMPFCNGTGDGDFATKVYMDAAYAIRTNGNSKFSSVSRSSVTGAIQGLGLEAGNFCSENEAIKVATMLEVESIILGVIVPLEDNQVRIVCEVLHIPSRQYSREITLTDTDTERLRRNLRQEIQQIFY
ncbi:MAG: hypothetical protein KDE26_24725 [Bacteroidetes bacterium]|nr:hypothetical protein [Bacteroidota bacterium]MCB1073779.1 hypothetical protein [Chlamydiia bacterium]